MINYYKKYIKYYNKYNLLKGSGLIHSEYECIKNYGKVGAEGILYLLKNKLTEERFLLKIINFENNEKGKQELTNTKLLNEILQQNGITPIITIYSNDKLNEKIDNLQYREGMLYLGIIQKLYHLSLNDFLIILANIKSVQSKDLIRNIKKEFNNFDSNLYDYLDKTNLDDILNSIKIQLIKLLKLIFNNLYIYCLDIKLDNCIVKIEGGILSIKLIDFGSNTCLYGNISDRKSVLNYYK